MSFLYPTFLWALFAVLVPVIIHLFSFRRHKTVYFSHTRFLETVKSDNRSKNKLKHLLILLSRMLMIATLVLAFAQPVIVNKKETSTDKKAKYIAVYIDNSFSMMNEGEQGNLLNQAKQYALEIAETYGSDYKYILLSNAMPAMYFRPMSKDVFMEECGKLDYSSSAKKISEICTRTQSILSSVPEAGNRFPVYLISDFQKYIVDFNALASFSKLELSFVKLQPNLQQNLSIDSVWFETPFRRSGQAENLLVQVKNHGNNVYTDVPVRLTINDSLKSVSTVSLEENQTAILSMGFTNAKAGVQKANVDLDDYPMSFDNNFYASWKLKETQKVLVIEGNKGKPFPKDLYADYSELQVNYQTIDALDLSVLSDYDVLIINAVTKFSQGFQVQISDFLKEGGVLWLIPDEKADIVSWNNFLGLLSAPKLGKWVSEDRELLKIADEHYFFKSTFLKNRNKVKLPVIKSSWQLRSSLNDNSENLIEYRDGSGFLTLVENENSFVYLLSSPINKANGDFYKHPLLIPVAWNIALNIPDEAPLYFLCGESGSVEINNITFKRETDVEIRNNGEHFIPAWKFTGKKSAQVYIPEILDKAGFYDIFQGDNFLSAFALNSESKESDLSYFTQKEIESGISEFGLNANILESESKTFKRTLINNELGEKLTFWFILLALVFLLMEILIIRLIKD